MSKRAMFHVVGQGTVKKICMTTYGTSELVFCNALHTLDLTFNLISINKFDQAGFNIVFGRGTVCFYDPAGKKVLCGKGASRMYLLGELCGSDKMSALITRS